MKYIWDDYSVKFVQWAKDNGLRLKVVTDGNEARPTVITRSRTNSGDHLYDGFKDGVGLWVERDTPRAVGAIVKRLRGHGYEPHKVGVSEATFKLSWEDGVRVASLLKMKKSTVKPPIAMNKTV